MAYLMCEHHQRKSTCLSCWAQRRLQGILERALANYHLTTHKEDEERK